MSSKPKLELTWIGKGEQPKLEPRILIEDPAKSYGNKNAENMLIYGDNLLALKALEQNYSGKIKCIYIDPPFNTGSAFEHYDDSIEHSIWLSLILNRLRFLHNLLSNDGAIFIHIDYNEEAYLRVLMDEVFGRNNFRNTIVVSRIKKNVREREYVRALNYSHDVILFYAKSDQTLILPPTKENKREERWHSFEAAGYRNGMDYKLFGHKPASKNHWRWTKENAESAVNNYNNWSNNYSLKSLSEYWEGTERVLRFLRPNPKTGKPEYFIPASSFEVLDTNWMDLTASSFSWNFPNGEKKEELIERILSLITKPDDWVLDSFLGSGTTAAVAHKIKRKWIGIELGEHCHTHCIPRLQKVCDGTDQGGISEAQNWKGGGGFKYYYLAPSLLLQDRKGNWIINKQYNAAMLAAAMAKHESFRFEPDEIYYWKQGRSTEKDFIFTTTNFVSVEFIDTIHGEMKSDESLLICCTSFSKAADKYPNITIKKIPKLLLGRCEFGKEDYSLNIVNLPRENDEPDFVPTGPIATNKPKEKKKVDNATDDLLADPEEAKNESHGEPDQEPSQLASSAIR